jgi:hypothetical protein
MAGPDLTGVIRELQADALAGVKRALGGGTALLVARVGDGEHQLLAQYDQPAVRVDATLFPHRGSLCQQLLQAAAAHRLGGDPATVLADLGPQGDRARQALVEVYGSSAGQVMLQLEDGAATGPPLSLTDALAPLEDDVPLVVFDAHRLDLEARWDIRELERPVLLVTRPEHVKSLTGQDAPFYGQTQTITLRSPSPREWMRALDRVGHRIHPTDLEWLLDRSRGRIAPTMAALRLKTAQLSHRTAWVRAVQSNVPRAHDLLVLARAVHTDAPTLLLALADGLQPYSVIPGAPSQRIARAMSKLRELDVIERPKRNVSQIADPLVEHALRSILNSSRMPTALGEVEQDD